MKITRSKLFKKWSFFFIFLHFAYQTWKKKCQIGNRKNPFLSTYQNRNWIGSALFKRSQDCLTQSCPFSCWVRQWRRSVDYRLAAVDDRRRQDADVAASVGRMALWRPQRHHPPAGSIRRLRVLVPAAESHPNQKYGHLFLLLFDHHWDFFLFVKVRKFVFEVKI